jgi:sterol 3beta-glucosyltransferase
VRKLTDVIVYHPKALGSYHIAEKLEIPLILSLALPLYTPTSAFPAPMLPAVHLGGWLNRLSYRLAVAP